MRDLVIIGGGPAGYELAINAKLNNLDVVLVEKNLFGGTCLQCGCIPTKTYYQYAKVKRQVKHLFGTDCNIDFETINNKKNMIVGDLTKGISMLLKGVEVINGYGKIKNNNVVSIIKENEEFEIETKTIVIATGSSPKVISQFKDNSRVVTSFELLNMTTIPDKLIIIGGGVIGIEMASIFNAFGSKVTIVEAMHTILPQADKEIVKRLLSYLKQQKINVLTNSKVNRIDNEVVLDNMKIPYDIVLQAIGRYPNISELGLDNVGIIYDNSGIKVNENFQTNISNIYAIGDCTGLTQLAHYAVFSGNRVLNHLLNKKDNINFNIVPSCIFCFPEVSMVGLTEEQCKNNDIEYQVIKKFYRANGKANAMQEVDGFIKMIVSNDLIIGCHIIGEESNILIGEVVTLMNEKITLSKAKDIIHAHPTLSEIIQECFK